MEASPAPLLLWDSARDEDGQLKIDIAGDWEVPHLLVIDRTIVVGMFGNIGDDPVGVAREHSSEIEAAFERAWHPSHLQEKRFNPYRRDDVQILRLGLDDLPEADNRG